MLALKGVQRDALRCSKRPQRHLPGTQEFPWSIQWGWRKIIPLPFLEQQDGSISPGILAKHFQGAQPEHLHQPFPKSPCFVLPKPPTVCSNQSHLRTGDGPCASQERGTPISLAGLQSPKTSFHELHASCGSIPWRGSQHSQLPTLSFLSANKILLLPFPSRFPPRAVFPSTNPGPAQAAAGLHPCRQLGKGTTTMESQSQQVGTQPRRAQAFAVHEFIAASRNQHQPSKFC